MASGFLTAWQEIEYSLAEWRMENPEHTSIEWLISLHSRWRMVQKWNSNFNLYTHMKKRILKTICSVVAAISLVLAGGVSENRIMNILWTGSWVAVFFLAAKGMEYCLTDEEKEEQV